jgi:predicted alpha/beta-fold hydrolase
VTRTYDFQPHPYLRGGHAQTLAGVYLPWPYEAYRAEQHRLPLQDGDTLVLHEDHPTELAPSAPAVLLVHGLGGCHRSAYMRRIAQKLRDRGAWVWRLDLRGCGAGEPLARSGTHCGRWNDVRHAIEFVSKTTGDRPLHVVGFSLGGSHALHVAADQGDARLGNLSSLLAVCPPIDLRAVEKRLNERTGRPYDRHFLKSIWREFRQRSKRFHDAPRVQLTRTPRRLREFDDQVTAPLAGYRDADDYYTRTSVGPRLSEIRLPTRVITAADDPIVPAEPLVYFARATRVEVQVTEHGGHLGFVGRRNGDPDRRWIDWRVIDWVLQQKAFGRDGQSFSRDAESSERSASILATCKL